MIRSKEGVSRGARLVMVISIISLFLFLPKFLFRILGSTFSMPYINLKVFDIQIPYGIEHILISVIIAAVLITIYFILAYCKAEVYNFSAFESEAKQRKYMLLADKDYRKILGVVSLYSALLTAIVVLMGILSNPYLWKYKSLSIIGISLAAFKLRKDIKNFFNNISDDFFDDTNVSIKYLVLAWVCVSFLVFLSGFGFYEDNVDGSIDIQFIDGDKPSANIIFRNKNPKEVNVLIIAENTLDKSFKIEECNKAFLEITNNKGENGIGKEDIENDNMLQKYVMPRSNFMYYKSIELHELKELVNKKNRVFIVIEFNMEEISGKKDNYKIVNEVIKENDKIRFIESKMNARI
ncbi:hypothetical protein [Wukongibacter baidiensis]